MSLRPSMCYGLASDTYLKLSGDAVLGGHYLNTSSFRCHRQRAPRKGGWAFSRWKYMVILKCIIVLKYSLSSLTQAHLTTTPSSNKLPKRSFFEWLHCGALIQVTRLHNQAALPPLVLTRANTQVFRSLVGQSMSSCTGSNSPVDR